LVIFIILLAPCEPDVPDGTVPAPVKISWVPIGTIWSRLGDNVGETVGEVLGNIGVNCWPLGLVHFTVSQQVSAGSGTK